MEEDVILKIKEYETLEVIKYICVIYAVFLFVLGAILRYEETIIQVTFICVFAIIVNMMNYGEFAVSEKGVKSNKTGFVRYTDIYRLSLDDKILMLYSRNSKRPFRIHFSATEDQSEINKIYKYIDSKVKRSEEDRKEHQEFIKKISE